MIVSEPAYMYAAQVERVVDGDTLDLSLDLGFKVWVKIRVRLFGVDTPEVYGVKKESEEYVKGKAATEFVEDWLGQSPDSRTVIVRSVDGKALGQGKYGRWLAEIERPDGASLNQALLDEGHAVRATY